MIIGFAVIVLLVVTVVANASAAFLVRRSLSSWADGAAVVAAQSVSEEAVYTGRMGEVLPLSQSAARESVGGFVARHGLAGRFEAFRVEVVTVRADGAVTVTFSTRMSLVLVNDVVPVRAGRGLRDRPRPGVVRHWTGSRGLPPPPPPGCWGHHEAWGGHHAPGGGPITRLLGPSPGSNAS
jgi:hypothetical protein